MILLFDIGNTHTHLGLAGGTRLARQENIPTAAWFDGTAKRLLKRFVGDKLVSGSVLCSVVPRATPFVQRTVRSLWHRDTLALTPGTQMRCSQYKHYPISYGDSIHYPPV